jgi:hypothetical protein
MHPVPFRIESLGQRGNEPGDAGALDLGGMEQVEDMERRHLKIL